MELFAEEMLRPWLLTVMLKYRKGRDRSDDKGEFNPGLTGITGDTLALTAIIPVSNLAKNLLGFAGRKHSVVGRETDLSEQEVEWFDAAVERIGRLIRKMNAEQPGLWTINPKFDDVHVGILKGHNPATGPLATVQPTYNLLQLAEEEIKGTKWEQYLNQGTIYEDTQVGG